MESAHGFAYGLTPFGVQAAAGTVITKFWSVIWRGDNEFLCPSTRSVNYQGSLLLAWFNWEHGHVSTPFHDDVIKWKHFPRFCPFVRGIHWSSVNSHHKDQWRLSIDVFFDEHLNKRLSKQSWRRWFETPSRSLWRHYFVSLLMQLYCLVNPPLNLSMEQ